jgi:hypothetical protein
MTGAPLEVSVDVPTSTKLSKCFALQGIKIPIRKDGVKGPRRGGDGDDDDEGQYAEPSAPTRVSGNALWIKELLF